MSWFCGVNGHLVSNCDKTKVQPIGLEPNIRQVQISTGKSKSTFEWSWCTKCTMWRMHTTNQHDDSKVLVDLTACIGDDSDLEDAEDDYNEMENIVSNL